MATTLSRSTLSGQLSRRHFLRDTGVMLVTGCIAALAPYFAKSLPSLAIPAAPPALLPVESLVRPLFTSHLGSSFLVGTTTIAIELVKVRDLRVAPLLAERGIAYDPSQNFSIVFRGSHEQPLAQDVYELVHDTLGRCALLLTPMRPEADGLFYEAVFNRLPPH